MISKTSVHALRAMIALAELPAQTYRGAGDIAGVVGAPRNYLGKLLQQLAHSGLLVSQRGARGGFALAGDPETTTLFDVLSRIEDFDAWERCFLGRAECSDDNPCHVHERYGPIREAYFEFLRGYTLKDLADAGGLARLEAILGDGDSAPVADGPGSPPPDSDVD